MSPVETLRMRGQVHIVVRDVHGYVRFERRIPNLVVYTGRAFIISRMTGTSKAVMSHMEVGSGTNPPAPEDATLQTPVGVRALISSAVVGGAHNEQVTYSATFGAGVATGTLTEIGIFNAVSGGDMLCRATFTAISKDPDDTLQVTWTVAAGV